MNLWVKILDKILNRQITQHLEKHQTLSDEQAGFRKGRNCTEQILTLELITQIQTARNEETHICLIDIKKAIDSVRRDQLFDLLKATEVDAHTIQVLKAMYQTEESSLVLNHRVTKPFHLNKGVR